MFSIDGKIVVMGEQWVHIGSRYQEGAFSDALKDPEDGLYWDSFPVLYNVDSADTYDMDNKLFYDFYDIDPVDVCDYCVSD